jgi:hypothetical protein
VTFVEHKAPAKASNPFTAAEHVFYAGEVLGLIHAIEREKPSTPEEDVAILAKYFEIAVAGFLLILKESWTRTRGLNY